MNPELALVQALHDDPSDETTMLALADWLEEQGQAPRAELLRLFLHLRNGPAEEREASESRVRQLLVDGVLPCWPTLTNSLGMRFSLIPAGVFRIGNLEEIERELDESPAHDVEITRPFYLGIYPVTQAEYSRVMNNNPSHFCPTGEGRRQVRRQNTDAFPVEMVTWDEAVRFCAELSKMSLEKQARRSYRLPTEAEWEYACRAAGTCTTVFSFGSALSSREANFDGNHPWGGAPRGSYLQRPTPVGSYRCNLLGLFDMHGNIYEWCRDWLDHDAYQTNPRRDPQGPTAGTGRVVRGGSWFSPASSCRSSYRGSNGPADRSYIIGFRVVCTVKS